MSKPAWSEAEMWQRQASEWQQEAIRMRRALTELVEDARDMLGYVPDYFREKWGYDNALLDAEQALRNNNSDNGEDND